MTIKRTDIMAVVPFERTNYATLYFTMFVEDIVKDPRISSRDMAELVCEMDDFSNMLMDQPEIKDIFEQIYGVING